MRSAPSFRADDRAESGLGDLYGIVHGLYADVTGRTTAGGAAGSTTDTTASSTTDTTASSTTGTTAGSTVGSSARKEPDGDASRRFVDAAGRRIDVEPHRPERLDLLVAMYDDFAPAHRAQGLPPVTRSTIEDWLDVVLDGTNVLAVHDGDVVGHVTFVADDDGAHELGAFVHQDYHDAGIGTTLVSSGLEHVRRDGATDVWLSVERSNRRAYRVYRRLGFREDVTSGRSVRMSRSLADAN